MRERERMRENMRERERMREKMRGREGERGRKGGREGGREGERERRERKREARERGAALLLLAAGPPSLGVRRRPRPASPSRRALPPDSGEALETAARLWQHTR